MRNAIENAISFLDRRFFYLLIGAYLAAGLWPKPGLLMRKVTLLTHGPTAGPLALNFHLPALMLSLLLFLAGMNVNYDELGKLFRHPRLLIIGELANVFLPLAFTFLTAAMMIFWHNPDEAQNVISGLAFVASTPIAASSTAWSQKVDGKLSLSLGLVVLSTILSPIVTPVTLYTVSRITKGDYSEDLAELAQNSVGWFLTLGVIVPALLGVLVRVLLGAERIRRWNKGLKALNLLDLLVLNYSNASVSLPRVLAAPDWDFLAIITAIVSTLCVIAFLTGWGVGALSRADRSEQYALMFAMGMNNNGSSLVISSLSMGDHPAVLLPIILYNLVQQIVAGVIEITLIRRRT